LQTILDKAKAYEPEERYATAAAMAADLRAFLRGEPPAARPPGPLERIARWLRRRPAFVWTFVGVLFIGASAGTYALAAVWDASRRAAEASIVVKEQLALTRGLLDEALHELISRADDQPPSVRAQHSAYLRALRSQYVKLAEENGSSWEARLRAVQADCRIVEIDLRIGDRAAAHRLKRTEQRVDSLLSERPNDPEARALRSDCMHCRELQRRLATSATG
jgi:hypothetical protein